MNPRKPRTSQARLDRLMLWARLCLARVANYCLAAAGACQPLERGLTRLLAPHVNAAAYVILCLIAIRAVRQLKTNRPRSHNPIGLNVAHIRRSVIGGRLRKLARAKDLRARITILLQLADHIGRHAARLAKTLRNGFTRRRGGFVLERNAPALINASLAASAALNSS